MIEDARLRLEPDDGFEVLVTDRLTIRRFEVTDVLAFAAYRSVPEIARWQSWDTPFSEEQARRFVAALATSHPDTSEEWFQFAVTETATGRLLGDVAAAPESDHRLARIGFTFAPEAQGHGFATEAVTALPDYLFHARGKHRVVADCDRRNLASVALLERVGMRREAHHLQSVWWKGEWTDEFFYAVLADEWLALRPAPGGSVGARALTGAGIDSQCRVVSHIVRTSSHLTADLGISGGRQRVSMELSVWMDGQVSAGRRGGTWPTVK